MPLHCMPLQVTTHTLLYTFILICFLFIYIALAVTACLRSLTGFGFPLFAPVMYEKLGYGKGDTILACLAIGLGCPVYVPLETILICFWSPTCWFYHYIRPFLLWKYGRRIRLSSRHATKPTEQKKQPPGQAWGRDCLIYLESDWTCNRSKPHQHQREGRNMLRPVTLRTTHR